MSTLNRPSRGGDIGGGCHSEPPSAAQATILGSAGLAGTPRLDFEAWTAFLRTSCGNQPDVIDPRAFTGWVCLLHTSHTPPEGLLEKTQSVLAQACGEHV